MTQTKIKNIAEEQVAVNWQEQTRQRLFHALKDSRREERGIPLYEIADIISLAFEPSEVQTLAGYLLMKKDK